MNSIRKKQKLSKTAKSKICLFRNAKVVWMEAIQFKYFNPTTNLIIAGWQKIAYTHALLLYYDVDWIALL